MVVKELHKFALAGMLPGIMHGGTIFIAGGPDFGSQKWGVSGDQNHSDIGGCLRGDVPPSEVRACYFSSC